MGGISGREVADNQPSAESEIRKSGAYQNLGADEQTSPDKGLVWISMHTQQAQYIPYVDPTLVHRLRRWTNIGST